MNAHSPATGIGEAIGFLKLLDLDGRHNLVAMDPNEVQPLVGRTFEPNEWLGVATWLAEHAHWNVYYSRNEPIPGAPHGKLAERHIAAIRALGADFDVAGGTPAEFEAQRLALDAKVLPTLKSAAPPTMVVGTGNGVQLVWLLAEKVPVTAVTGPDAKAVGNGIRKLLGGDGVANLDRLMRLPGMVNHSTVSKRAKGKLGGKARMSWSDGQSPRPTIESLGKVYGFVTADEITDEAVQAVAAEIDMALARAGITPPLQARLDASKLISDILSGATPPRDTSGSGWRATLASQMGREGFDLQDYVTVALGWDRGQPTKGEGLDLRALARDWTRVGTAAAATAQPEAHGLQAIEDDAGPDTSAWNEQGAKVKQDAIDAKANAPVVMEWVNPADWYGIEPKEKQWYVPGLIPHNEVTMMTGKGGVGKSLLGMQLMVCIAMGKMFFGREVRRAKVILFMCEDDWDEMHARLVNICAFEGVDMRELGEWLRIAPRKYEDNLLAAFEKAGTGVQVRRTKVFEAIQAYAREFGAEVVMLDTIADVFGGDEINRQQVRQFVQGCAGRLAGEFGACVMLGHPSKSGQAEGGDGTSGSTAWRGSVRSHLYLDEDGDATGPSATDYRKLTLQKSNYGPAGEVWKLRWQAGVLRAVSSTGTRPSQAPGPGEQGEAAEASGALPDTREVMHGDILSAIREAFEAKVPMKLAANAKNPIAVVLRKRHRKALEGIAPKDLTATLKELAASGRIVEERIGRDASDNPVVSVRVVEEEIEAGEASRFFRDEEAGPGLFD